MEEVYIVCGDWRLSINRMGFITPQYNHPTLGWVNATTDRGLADGEITDALRAAYSAVGQALESWLRSMD